MAEQKEEKRTLYPGHPQAGYVSPDLSATFGAGTLPDEELDAIEERDQARQDEADAVAEHEDKVAREEAAEGEAAPKTPKPAQAAKTGST